ncbi:hypothetical protein AB0N31_23020 [Streptomyces sp. NPDC051051]
MAWPTQHTSTSRARRQPTRQHIHTIIRTPNGNDYGVDLLKLHLETDP